MNFLVSTADAAAQSLTVNQIIAIASAIVVAVWGALAGAIAYIRHLMTERDMIRVQEIAKLEARNLKLEGIIDAGVEADRRHTDSLDKAVQVAVVQHQALEALYREIRDRPRGS